MSTSSMDKLCIPPSAAVDHGFEKNKEVRLHEMSPLPTVLQV